ncbi:hypothetical protein E3W66_03060 [Gammaproteobacteria bacterium LSUCC0057]|uniref:Large ribosomal RNA subunit accumulation protein YceD n=1 Tax=Gammaproteobacteria bacterium LSUCC0057 TaxID=2559237 RepID=A0A4Y8UMS4_9GAMM|nr:hypothetical protein E3W66_03060 [Gammaproteobacteria bacterium LSUCC0057]
MALPSIIDPRKLAQQQALYQGSVAADQLTRFAQAVTAIESDLTARVEFALNASRKPCVSGQLQIAAAVPCQRCLESVTIAIAAEFAVEVVWNEEQAASIVKRADSWIVAERQASLLELLEDELLLALPVVSYHDEGQCASDLRQLLQADNEQPAASENPFAVLQSLKKH